MTVTSRLLRPEPLTEDLARKANIPLEEVGKPLALMAFLTNVDDKKIVITGIGVGNPDRVTAVAQVVLDRMSNYAGPNCALHIVLFSDAEPLRERIREAVDLADHGDMVFVLCGNSEIYDKINIIETLGVQPSFQNYFPNDLAGYGHA